MLCPICKTDLSMAERQGIEIDYCSSCRGVWLDRGELDKIIERSAQDLQPAPQSAARPAPASARQDYGRDHDFRRHEREHRPRYKKKSLLGELFDF